MSTTTLKLPEELKERIASVAKAAGKTSHAFMVEALAARTALAERRRDFVAAAMWRNKKLRNTVWCTPPTKCSATCKIKSRANPANGPKPSSAKRLL